MWKKIRAIRLSDPNRLNKAGKGLRSLLATGGLEDRAHKLALLCCEGESDQKLLWNFAGWAFAFPTGYPTWWPGVTCFQRKLLQFHGSDMSAKNRGGAVPEHSFASCAASGIPFPLTQRHRLPLAAQVANLCSSAERFL